MQARGGGCEISVGAPALSFFQSLPHRSASPTRCHRGVTRASSGRACGSVRVLCPRARTVVTAHQYAVQGTWGAQCRIRSCSGADRRRGCMKKRERKARGKGVVPRTKSATRRSRAVYEIASFIFLVEARPECECWCVRHGGSALDERRPCGRERRRHSRPR